MFCWNYRSVPLNCLMAGIHMVQDPIAFATMTAGILPAKLNGKQSQDY